jgi:type I restriction enzyme R subunit
MPDEQRELEIGLRGLLDPHNLADIAANFIVCETRAGVTTKKLARYQQFRAANKLVARVVGGEHDRGIVWHTQGSGKSLTMVLAARKLRVAGLGNPTVFIVIDRVDLDDQINETFTATSIKGVVRAFSRAALRRLLERDYRGVVITTVQKFDETMSQLVGRDNVIVLVDEAHRTQEGVYGIRMRDALPQAKLFAFTGTPIEKDDRSTWRAFAPEIDGVHERYLDAYTPKQAIEDEATVQVLYEPHLAEWRFRDEDLDASFAALTEDLGEEEREKLKSDAARLRVVAKAPERVKAIAEDAIAYLREHTEPQGFKAQLVAVDREACVLYAEALLAAGMRPEELVVIYTPNTKKDDDSLRRWYAAEQCQRRSGAAAPTGADGEVELDEDSELELAEAKARKDLIAAFKQPENPLKLLIVTDMLLTGFDAPVEQVMFLDKPLRGAKLLQAIMRTNRPFPEKRKDSGVIIDYWGVFERLEEAFAEFSPDELELAVFDLAELRERFPVLLAEALALLAGLPAAQPEYEQMMWLLRHFGDEPQAAELFEERFKAAQSAFEVLSPDPALAPHLDEYRRLVRLRALWRHGARLDQADSDFDLDEYRPQTHGLVKDAVSQVKLRSDLSVYRIDGSYARRIEEGPGSPEEKAAEVEAAIEFEIRERGENDPVARSLAERLERLRERKQQADVEMLSLLDNYLELADHWAKEKEAHAALGLSQRAQGFLSLVRTSAPELGEGRSLALARQLDEIVGRHASFAEWVERDDVLRDIRLEVIRLLAHDAATAALAQPEAGFVDQVLTVAATRASVPA